MKAKITDRFIKTGLPRKGGRLEVNDVELKGFCLVRYESGILTFFYRYRNAEGRTLRYRIGKYGSITATQARRIARTKAGEVQTGTDIQEEKRRSKLEAERARNQTLKNFFERKYKPYCLSQMRNGRTQIWNIESYFVSEWPEVPLADLNTFRIQNWRRARIKQGLGPAGVNRPVSALKAMLNRAVEWEIIDHNPLMKLKPLAEDRAGVVRYLSAVEEKRLREALDVRQAEKQARRQRYNDWRRARKLSEFANLDSEENFDLVKPLVLLALNTGMRRGELFNLKLADLNLDQRQLVVQGAGSKSGQSRIIPLNREAMAVLRGWIDSGARFQSDWVFPSPRTGKRLDNVNKAWRDVLARADISNFRFHDLRHSFASKLVMNGVDLYTVKELLGHSTIELTQRYAHLAPEHKARAVSVLDDVLEQAESDSVKAK